MPRFLRESWGYPSKLCSVSSLDSWNFEFCGFLSAKPLRWRQPAEDPRKLGKYVNTGAEQEPLGDWVQGPPPLCRSFLCCQSSKGLNHKNAMEMTVQDFPRLKWIIHRPTLRQVLRLLKQEDPGGLLTPCFFFAAPKAAEHDQRWSFAFFLPSNCQSICEDFFGPKALENFGHFSTSFHDSVLKAFFCIPCLRPFVEKPLMIAYALWIFCRLFLCDLVATVATFLGLLQGVAEFVSSATTKLRQFGRLWDGETGYTSRFILQHWCHCYILLL